MSRAHDEAMMLIALALGERGQGRTWPNPAVGCIIENQGRIVGRGWTAPGGRPHAEPQALARAGEAARGATAYVTLEPCSNYGRTAPCSNALIKAGIRRVVVGCVDPDPRVNGAGLRALREAGIEVVQGVLEERCLQSHQGLYRRIQDQRPMVTLKLAQSLDGRIALANGQSKWLTGPLARHHAHRLRAQHDAILIGSGTVLADDPMLDCRIEGLEALSPVRVVLDRRGRTPAQARLVTSAPQPALHIYGAKHRSDLPQSVVQREGLSDLLPVLQDLAGLGITRLLVEGGASVAAAFLKQELVDRIELFTAPKIIGGDGLPSVADLGLSALASAGFWEQIDHRRLGDDQLCVFSRRPR